MELGLPISNDKINYVNKEAGTLGEGGAGRVYLENRSTQIISNFSIFFPR